MRRTWGIAVLVLALAGAAACSGGDDDDEATADHSSGDDTADTTIAREEEALEASSTADGDSAGAAGGESASGVFTTAQGEPLPDVGTRVVRTADLRIEVEKGTFGTQLRAVSTMARSLGGFVQSSSTTSYEEGEASGDITIRVPVDQYDTAMERLGAIGTVEQSSEDGQDVTDQLVDLDARLRALQAEEAALNALMGDAANVNEVLSIRSTAVGIRQQIEQLAAQQASLEDRASFSTISVLLHEATADLASTSPGEDDWTLAEAFDTAVDAARSIVGALVVAVGIALPLLPFAAVAWWVARRRRRADAATAG
jgi:hypothetical protein